jgi:hypothetical protein
MKDEIGDKTFLIIFIFVIGWSNPLWIIDKNPDYRPGYAVFADGRTFIQHRLTYVSPTRIFLLSTIGTLWPNWAMTGKTTPGKENHWVFWSALILVFIMLNYAFRLMSAHFAIVTKLEAEFEHYRSDKSKVRDRRITDWAQGEVEYSKLFNEAHKESVFSDFK